MTEEPKDRRTARAIRASLAESRHRLDSDLAEIETRFHESFHPRELIGRHPALFGVAGLLLGALLFRHPAMIGKGLSRLVQLGAPLVLRSLLKRD